MRVELAARRAMRLLSLSLLPMALFGCATNDVDTAPAPRAGLACVDDSPACIQQRQSTLKSLMSDRDRRWVKEPATAEAYASGVRLFAFKGRKKELTCEELSHGRREAEAGPSVLRGAGARSLSPAQVSRGAMLATEVSKELAVEIGRRCRA